MSFNRRQFLALSGLALAHQAIPINHLYQPRKKLGVALLGLGSYSTYQLAPALQMTEYCELTGIITGSPEKVPLWQHKYGIKDSNVYSYDNMLEVADNDDIDVIYVVTPTGTHKEFTIKAANAGKHVWCEKPMAMTVSECREMIETCNKNKVGLTIGYRVQHEPNTLIFNSYSRSLPLGTITSASSYAGYLGNGGSGWRFQKKMGGGALYDMGVYTVNGLRNALNMEPVRVVKARQYSDRPMLYEEVDETTEYTLEFPGGLIAKGFTSVGQNYNSLRIEAENGWYEMSPMQSYTGVQGKRSDGVLLNEYVKNQQSIQMDDDAKALMDDNPMMIDPIEGLKDIRIIEAIIESAEKNITVDL